MKTTRDLPYELMRAVKVRAPEENSNLQEVASSSEMTTVRNRVQFPPLKCVHPAEPGEELAPECVGAILADGELFDIGTVSSRASAPCNGVRAKGIDGVGGSLCC